MNKNVVYITVAVVLVAVLGLGYAFKHQIKSLLMPVATPTSTVSAPQAPAATNPTPQTMTAEADFDGSKFTPNPLTVKVGTKVNFVSSNGDPMWVASDPHPTHTDLPGFDELTSGVSYSYTFTKVGSWGYHNHLQPSIRGTIIVTQ